MSLLNNKRGTIILLTGVSGSGKTTLGGALKTKLEEATQRPVEMIDGDVVRDFFEQSFGFSLEERFEVTKKIAFAADLLSKNGIDVIVANIAGQYEVRDFLRKKWGDYVQVFLDADIEECIKNDPKNVYQNNLSKEAPQLLGVDYPYEKPRNPNVIVQPYKETVEESLMKIMGYLSEQKLITV